MTTLTTKKSEKLSAADSAPSFPIELNMINNILINDIINTAQHKNTHYHYINLVAIRVKSDINLTARPNGL